MIAALRGLLWIVRRSLRQHALSTLVTAGSVALASGLVMAVYAIQAQAVPTVPGAQRLRPEPRPRAIAWAGWANRNAAPGRAIAACLRAYDEATQPPPKIARTAARAAATVSARR